MNNYRFMHADKETDKELPLGGADDNNDLVLKLYQVMVGNSTCL